MCINLKWKIILVGVETLGTQEYTLCTNYPDPNSKANRTLLESMLRTVYGHMPKSVKFLNEKL
jgi:hypothetical protein